MQKNNLTEQKNLETLKNFIKTDLSIKNDLLELAPNKTDNFDESSKINYIDKLYKSLKDLEFDFKSSLKGFNFDDKINESLTEFFNKEKEKLAISNYNNINCNEIYQNNFSDMSKTFIEDVKKTFVGYTSFNENDLNTSIKEAKTINELLHTCHSYIMNNQSILSSITKISEKQNQFKYPISLYGEQTKAAEELFNNFPMDLDVGWTDIISLEDQIFMMVRDRGHALTIDIDTSKNDYLVKYFVPKLCNEEMIKALPGINKDNISQNGASGYFQCKNTEFTNKLFSFIEKVPTDNDMPPIHIKNIPNFNKNKSNDTNKNEFSNPEPLLFSIDDVKEMTTEKGKQGRKFEKILNLLSKFKIFSKDKNNTKEIDQEVTKYDK
ncbi:MAG: hypothetical protein HG453_005540 [Clostridiales bacterium]|nr:hypothetical protein [Clostridiales bacterium]